jgi:toxin-antitoxin system PIN domain toxin
MHLADINVWVAMAFASHSHHQSARAWFDRSDILPDCCFCRFTQLGFLRIANNAAAVSSSVVTQSQAWKLYDHFLAHPRVSFADEPAGIEPIWRQSTQLASYSSKTWNDAYLAAFAQAGGLEIVTFDQGFAQYKSVRSTILS